MELTKKDIEKIQEEIRNRKEVIGPEIRERLATARAQGDLSENFEYSAAKRENNKNNARIRYLEKLVETATVLEDKAFTGVVDLNTEVTIHIPSMERDATFRFVSSIRGNSLENRISPDSPVGKALFGHKKGDTVTVVVNPERSYDATITDVREITDDGTDELALF